MTPLRRRTYDDFRNQTAGLARRGTSILTERAPLASAAFLPCLLALASPAWAQDEGAGPRGFLLEVTSPSAPLGGAPEVTASGAGSESVDLGPKDDGVPPDATAGDEIYTAHVPAFSGATVDLRVTAGDRSWTTSVSLDADRPFSRVTLELGSDGDVVATPIAGGGIEGQPLPPADGPAPQPVAQQTAGHGDPDRAAEKPESIAASLVLWGVLAAAFGLGLALAARWLGRRSEGAARLSPAPPQGTVAPVTLDAGDLDAALAGPLREHRIVALGEVPDGHPALFAVEDRGPLPGEVVAAVEGLAATSGPAPALLITDVGLLDRPGRESALDALDRRVARRFPMWVVDGPAEWPSWPAPDTGEEDG